uniref:AMP-binding domain-containing protein n=1 Tax=Syphacia muris TaxID=451379 RepID=A0A0N5AYF6_9BILA
MEFESFLVSPTFKIVEVASSVDCFRKFAFDEIEFAVEEVSKLLNSAKNNLFLMFILRVLKSGNVFTCVSPSNTELDLKEQKSRKAWCLVSLSLHSNVSIDIFDTTVYFTFFEQNDLPFIKCSKNCYSIQTSGTTGIPKEVIVPYSAIMPNVDDFCARFKITKFDVISFSTALIFDPSIIELFVAASVGSTLLIIPDSARVRPAQFGEILIKYAATFLQITPSALMLFSSDSLIKLLGEKSFLRILLVGGERFPVTFLRRFYTGRSVTKLYNVYGLTEVSCWASCRSVDFESLMERNDIDIGDPIKDTLLQVSQSNELLIRGRSCIIDGVSQTDWLCTGDSVKVDDRGKIYICGRISNQVKLNGIRLNLNEIELYVTSLDSIDSCVVIPYNNCLIMFIKSNLTVLEKLKQSLPLKWRCHAIINVQHWPITINGKVDRKALLEQYRQSNEATTLDDIENIFVNFGIDIVKDRNVTFSELGFTSLKATELMLQIQHLVADPDFSVVQYILTSDGTVEGLLKALCYNYPTTVSSPSRFSKKYDCVKQLASVVDNASSSSLVWQENMEKCIDATPVLNNNFVIIGSHSGRLVSLNLVDGTIRWEKRLQGRIEGTVAVNYGIVVVASLKLKGCYDHNVYFLNEESGNVLWKFTTNDIVKSTSKFIADGQCLIASHDQHLRLLDYKKRRMVWFAFCGGTILADVAVFGNLIVVATLAGDVLTLKKVKNLKALYVYLFICMNTADLKL